MKKLWHFLRTPSRRWSVLALVLAGVGVTLAGTVGLHYGFEKTSSLEFCISCHSMKDTVYPEYKESIHFKNASGVQAVCTDCHQPKDFVGKVARKMEAANDLYQEYIGHSIDTQEKFEDRRLHLAEKVWARMSSQNSKTCKSCHSYDNMDHAKQSPAAALAMKDAAAKNMNCIECHKGIAHELPNMAGASGPPTPPWPAKPSRRQPPRPSTPWVRRISTPASRAQIPSASRRPPPASTSLPAAAIACR